MAAYTTHAVAALPQAKPYDLRSFSNGRGAGVVDLASGRLTTLQTALHANDAPGKPTADLCWDAYFGLQVDGNAAWLDGKTCSQPACQPGARGYVDASGVVRDERSLGPVVLTQHTFAPRSLARPAVVLSAEAHNTDAAAPHGVRLAALLNFHLGAGAPDPDFSAERIVAKDATGNARTLVETGAGKWSMVYRAYPVGSHEVVNPWKSWTAGTLFGDGTDSGTGNDRVAGFAGPLVTLAPGEKARLVVVAAVTEPGSSTEQVANEVAAWMMPAETGGDVVATELDAWNAWHAGDVVPPGLDAQETQIYRRSLALLRMAQGKGGQIVASLPPGMWHITWPRDGSYAAMALLAAGHPTEARDFLEFILAGKVGQYEKEVGAPYIVSVCRYHGDGTEESDGDPTTVGPNIELDDTGLVLWAAARYVLATGDTAWLATAWPKLAPKAADMLLAARDATGLLHADSSIWERHWNGNQKHFTYSNLVAVRGLCTFAKVAELVGEKSSAATWRKAAQGIHAATAQLVTGGGVLLGDLEEAPANAVDAAAVEAFLDGQYEAKGNVAKATLARWDEVLLAGGGPGYARNDDGDWYDRAEWIFIDARIARAAARAGLDAKAKKIRDRLTALGLAGGGQLPELIEVEGADAGQFAGAIPMIGFGAGAYVLTLLGDDVEDDLAQCLEAGAQSGDAEGAEPDVALDVDASFAMEGVSTDEAEAVAALDVPATSDAIDVNVAPDALDADMSATLAEEPTNHPRPADPGGCAARVGADSASDHTSWLLLLGLACLTRRSIA